MKYALQVISVFAFVVIHNVYCRPGAGTPYSRDLRPQIQSSKEGKAEKIFHYDGVQVPVTYIYDSWPKQPSGDLSFNDKLPVHELPLRKIKPETLTLQKEDTQIDKKETDEIISKLQNLANLKYSVQLDDTKSNIISDKWVFKRMKNTGRSKPSKQVSAIKDSIIKGVQDDLSLEGMPKEHRVNFLDAAFQPKRVIQQRVMFSPIKALTPAVQTQQYSKSPLFSFNQLLYPGSGEQMKTPQTNYLQEQQLLGIKQAAPFRDTQQDLAGFINLNSLNLPQSFPSQSEYSQVPSYLDPATSFLGGPFLGMSKESQPPFLEAFSTAVEYALDGNNCKHRENHKSDMLNRLKSNRVLDLAKPNERETLQEVQESGEVEDLNAETIRDKRAPEKKGDKDKNITNFTVIIITGDDDEAPSRAEKKLDTLSKLDENTKNDLLHSKDSNSHSGFKGPLQFFGTTTTSAKPIRTDALRSGSDGPQISTLKVRKGGVAIAGPGGIATAGSGGTAIVGPGGTAYTTADGMAVVGSGGKVVSLGQTNPQHQAILANQNQQLLPYSHQLSPQYSALTEFLQNRPVFDVRPGLARAKRISSTDESAEDTQFFELMPYNMIGG